MGKENTCCNCSWIIFLVTSANILENVCNIFFSYFSVLVFIVFLIVVGLDIQDEMGRHEVGHIDNSMKISLNQGAGCRFEGEFSINKVSFITQ